MALLSYSELNFVLKIVFETIKKMALLCIKNRFKLHALKNDSKQLNHSIAPLKKKSMKIHEKHIATNELIYAVTDHFESLFQEREVRETNVKYCDI